MKTIPSSVRALLRPILLAALCTLAAPAPAAAAPADAGSCLPASYPACVLPLTGPLPSAWPYVGPGLTPDPAVRWGRLPNGLRYAIRTGREPKGRASLRLAVAAGSLEERADQQGLAHFLEHMAFNGSAHFPPGTLVEYFQRLGMSFGGDTNAYTSFDRTEYQLELPDTRPQSLDRALTLFGDYIGSLLLEPRSIAKERGIILSEKRARDSVDYRAYVDEMKFLLPGSRLPVRMPIGLESVISASQRPPFADFYDTWYRPSNAVIVVVGDFDPADVEARLVRLLGPVRAHGAARAYPDAGPVAPAVGLRAALHSDPEAPSVSVSIEQILPVSGQPDSAARRLSALRRSLACTVINRRLAVLSKQEGAPFIGGSASVDDQFNLFRNASIGLACRPEDWSRALAVGEQELRRALHEGFSPAELAEAVALTRNDLEQAAHEEATRQDRDVADELVNAPVDREVSTTPSQDLALLAPELDRVRPEDCRRALVEAWGGDTGRFIYVAGNLRLQDPERVIEAVYRRSQATALKAVAATGRTAFAYADFGPAGAVAQRRQVADLGVTLVTLSNGVRLSLKRTDFEAGRVQISVRVGGGLLSAPKALPGLPLLASAAFLDGGLGRHDAEELRRLLAGHTTETEFGVEDDAFVLSGLTSAADLGLEFRVLCAYLSDPGWRPEALRQFRKGIEPLYAELDHTVEGPMRGLVPRLIAGGDSRFGIPERALLEARNLDELRQWLAPQLARGPVEVAVVGDFDPEAVIAQAARTFGALAARRPKPDYAAERILHPPQAPIARQFTVDTVIPRGVVEMDWPAPDGFDRHRARRLDLLASVLEDRLRVRLREQMGSTYSPGAGVALSETFPGFGRIEAFVTVEPARAAEVTQAIRSVARDLAVKGVTPDELGRAREPLLTAIRTSERTNGYWLESVLACAQEHPERLDWSRTRRSDFEAASKPELDALARAYLDPAKASVFVSLPAPGKPVAAPKAP